MAAQVCIIKIDSNFWLISFSNCTIRVLNMLGPCNQCIIIHSYTKSLEYFAKITAFCHNKGNV